MATYYRWRKSTVKYEKIPFADGYTSGYLYGNADGDNDFPNFGISYTSNFSFNRNTGMLSYSGATVVPFEDGKTLTIGPNLYLKGDQSQSGETKYWNETTSRTTISMHYKYSDDGSISDAEIELEPNALDLTSHKVAGTFVEYVYSTNPSAYPTDGASGNYWYDQRTTVESPTAPSNITTPNPITTPSITVSWRAATSNTNYPVNLYELSYSTNGGSSWTTVGTTASTSLEVDIPPVVTSIQFRVRARDSNGQWGSYSTSSTAIPVYIAPTLTVPQMLMQGQPATVSWTSIEGADSYTLQRKANTDSDWTQVYSGAALTYSETAGTWTTVQYRVQAVFDGTPGGWATSAEIPVVSASALVISGQDGDLGTLVNDVPYSISTDTGNQITATITANGAVIFSGNVGNSTAGVIPVLDLINGEGTIVIEASVTASSGPMSAVRTWTYTKTMMTFPNAGSIAELTKDGKVMWPETLAEAVRIPGGKTLDQVMGFPCQIYTGSYVGTGTYGANNPTEITFPFEPDFWGFLGVVISGEFNTQAYQPFDPWGMNQIDHAGAVISCSYEGSTVKFTSNNAGNQKNTSGYEYYFIGIKIG